MEKRTFYREWSKRALHLSLKRGDFIASVAGNSLTIASQLVPGWPKGVTDLIWQVPIYGLAAAILWRFVSAPYEMWKELKVRGDVAEAQAGISERPEQRAARLLDVERAKHQATTRAKAEQMHERLALRRHSIMEPGKDRRNDSYLAAMWDAEQRGEAYDTYHRSTFTPAGEARSDGQDSHVVTGRRRNIISRGRDIAHRFTIDPNDQRFRWFLESEGAYPDIRPHLSAEYLVKLHQLRMAYARTSEAAYHPLVSDFLTELDRLEKEWKVT